MKKNSMKMLSVMALLLSSCMLQADTVPLVKFNFNTPDGSTTAASSGSLAGVSGTFNGDSRFYQEDANHAPSNGDKTQMLQVTGVSGSFSVGGDVTSGLTSMTVCGWLKPYNSTDPSRRLFSNATGVDINVSYSKLTVVVNGSAASQATAFSINEGQWQFFAVTYDSTTNTVGYFRSASTSPLSNPLLTNTTTLDAGAIGSSANDIFIGNYPGSSTHGLTGLYDNIALYDSALTQTELETVMQYNDIPEPTTMALLGLGGIAALIRRRK